MSLLQKLVLFFFPVSSALIFDDVEELVFEEGNFFVVEGSADVFPVFIVFLQVDQFVRFQHFHMNKTYNEPNI